MFYLFNLFKTFKELIDIDKKYKPKEIADMLNVTVQVIYKWIKQGKLKGYRQVSRYFVYGKDLKEFAEANHFDIE